MASSQFIFGNIYAFPQSKNRLIPWRWAFQQANGGPQTSRIQSVAFAPNTHTADGHKTKQIDEETKPSTHAP
jgi:hypothetical protein